MFDEISTTDLIAIIAVIMAAFSLALEIRRWWESGVKLKMTCVVDTIFKPNIIEEPNNHIYIVVSNRGDTPTTLTGLTFIYHPTIWNELRYNFSMSFIRQMVPYSRFWKYFNNTLRAEAIPHRFKPYFLDTGTTWHDRIFQTEEFDKYLNEGRFWLLIHASHTDKPIKRRLIRHKNRKDVTTTIPQRVVLPHKPEQSLKMKMKTNKGDTNKAEGG